MDKPVILQDSEETILLSKMKEIGDSIEMYTVTLYFCNKEDKGLDPEVLQNGSGVLVKIEDENLILTAGHIIDAWEKVRLDHIVIAIEPQTVFMNVTASGYCYTEGVDDFGFLALHPDDAIEVECLSKKYLSHERLLVTIVAKDVRLVISGFPKIPPAKRVLSHIPMQGKSLGPDYKYGGMFRVWVEREHLKAVLGENDSFGLNISGGMSGGGCWFPENFSINGWKPSNMLLAGTHFRADKLEDSGYFEREMSVSKHLQLIATKIHSLRKFISQTWGIEATPQMEE